jgi:hypothetical protein
MKILVRGWLVVLLLCGVAHTQQAGMTIPEVRGTSFAEQAVNLPKDLNGKAGVLVVGFTQGSRDAVTAWGKRLAVDYYDASDVAYYEMPVLAGVPRLMRGFVIGRIKSSVSDRGKRHFVPILENEAAWKSTAQYKSGDDAYVLVVDSAGTVRWQTHGPFSDGAYGAMKGQLEGLRSGSVRAVSGQAGR